MQVNPNKGTPSREHDAATSVPLRYAKTEVYPAFDGCLLYCHHRHVISSSRYKHEKR